MSVRCVCVYVFVYVVVMERGCVWGRVVVLVVGGGGGRKLVLSIFNQPFQHIYGRQ